MFNNSLKSGFVGVSVLDGQIVHDHLERRLEDGLISLGLPEVDLEAIFVGPVLEELQDRFLREILALVVKGRRWIYSMGTDDRAQPRERLGNILIGRKQGG